MEYEVRVDEKGRILIPKEVRDKLNLSSKVKLIVEDDKIIIKKVDKEKILEEFAGKFKINWNNIDLEKVYKEAVDERSKKWIRDILT
ncbi:AbrB/MazE/SpoVT family DNA-binding domain-containing protein [Sulfolobus tengchongensis]|uniref:AbrB/MazE/SpoVT family DNA-binding domain-containing protein n=1 Tax=Sulfolobus tengchongensis TaxID=207809 RepID=A0AAX4KXE2_9CREN